MDAEGPRDGEFVGLEEVRVRYAETDAQAVVYHSNYLVYFEIGRTGWIRDAGYPYAEFEKSGHALVVAEAQVRYLRSARYDDRLVVETRLKELRTRSCTFSYLVHRAGEASPIVEGWTALVCVGDDGKAVAIPSELVTAMRRLAAL